MCNNTLVENQTEPYTASMATLLMKTDVPSSDTSASGSLMTYDAPKGCQKVACCTYHSVRHHLRKRASWYSH
jgi:hypothetical protein